MSNRIRTLQYAAVEAWRPLCVAALLTLLLSSCASLPTQEMSDARQALQAARLAGADEYASVYLNRAETSLSDAQNALGTGAYDRAREQATEAKQQAILARNVALAINDAKNAVAAAQESGTLSQETREHMQETEIAAQAGNHDRAIQLARETEILAERDLTYSTPAVR